MHRNAADVRLEAAVGFASVVAAQAHAVRLLHLRSTFEVVQEHELAVLEHLPRVLQIVSAVGGSGDIA